MESESLVGDAAAPETATSRVKPTTSVVIAWRGETRELERTVNVLSPRCRLIDAELVIVHAGSATEGHGLARAFPSARIVSAPSAAATYELRQLGAAAASGDIVVLVDQERALPSFIRG